MKTIEKIKLIFFEALEKETKGEREAYLSDACRDDPSLRVEIDALLKGHFRTDSFVKGPILDPHVSVENTSPSETAGTVIGRYKLLERIGEGGMAVVYMAEQEKPIRRKVALKIIKLGMDTKSVIARFEAERQALAMMDHPSIAKVLDAGSTETGRPYFAMELVQGVSITEYCDKNSLSTKERLGLFIQVCNAVQHAHQKGIIHRDIKPSNVMVTMHDGKPKPKVIDFGIAKATSQKLTEKTLFTRYAHIIGTPAYMSPEQAELSDTDIDTRSDIYSLGILLYELLTGTTPFGEKDLRKAGYVEMQRVIREEEPAKPSTKLSTLGETLTDVAKHHNSSPDVLARAIRGDLDWIVMKSLEKDRARRYDTVNALAVDLRRHLDNKPILARAPKITYLLQKFLRRHRSQTIAVTSVALMVSAVMVVLTVWIENRSLHVEAESNKRLSEAREYFAKGDFTAALETAESILNSEHVGSEARGLYASTCLQRAQYYESFGDKDNVVADMERYVNILDPLEATNQDNRRFKDILTGLWRGTPENLGPIVNSPFYDNDPHLSPDGLELYFTSRRPGGEGDSDIWVTTRETVNDPWEEPESLGAVINHSGLDGAIGITDGGLRLWITSTRPEGSGRMDIWTSTRASISGPWRKPENLGSTVNSPADDAGIISADGRFLIICSNRPGGCGGQDLWMSKRPTPSDPWGIPVNLGPTINTSVWDFVPSLSTDGLLLFFCSTRPGSYGAWDIWMTRRATRDHDWGTPVNLGPAVNSSPDQGNPGISSDGSTLYFGSRRPGGSGNSDIWQVSIVSPPQVEQEGNHANLIQTIEKGNDGKEDL
ncbi:MAG: protein kinase domain-containing protein [Planctomycetota bacterium]